MEPPTTSAGSSGDLGARRVTFSESHQYHHFPPSLASTSEPGTPGLQHYHEPPEPNPGCWAGCKQRVKALKREVLALHYAVQDPRTPLLAKAVPLLAIAYALSPIDLIPDFIPVLGLLDDLVLLPLLLWISIKLIPAEVMADARLAAETKPLRLHRNWGMALFIFLLWMAGLLGLTHWLVVTYGDERVALYEWAVLTATTAVCVILAAIWAHQRIRYEWQQQQEWEAALLQDDQPPEGA